jgi:hypothetical protein
MTSRKLGGRARVRRAAAVVVLGLASAGSGASAQAGRRPQVSADSARHIADLFFRAVAEEKWEAAAAFVDTIAIKRKVAQDVSNARSSMPTFLTIEEIMQRDPNMPREVAEYELKRYREQTKNFNPAQFIAFEFAGVNSIRELQALSALEATARFLQALDSRWMIRKQFVESGCAGAGAVPLPVPIHRILAATLASDSVAYVLHEDEGFESVPDADLIFEPMVMRLRLGPQGWRIVPSRSMLTRSNGFAAGVTCDSTRKKIR